MESDIAQCQDRMAQPGFWDDQSQAQSIIQEMNHKESTRNAFLKLVSDWEDLQVEVELYEETLDRPLWEEIEKNCYKFEQSLKAYQLSLLLSEEHDHCNAILEIHPGAGGKESQDWGQMLLRMYERWASQHDYHISVIDYQNGEEAGIKSVTLEVSGDKAYGFLKSEKGVHRLIRISPFDSNGKRHTSFCSIDVTPMIDDSIEIHINQDDLRIDTYRASGAGGQHINKTSSAVRITHLPTGIVTSSQAQRSQLQNRETAMNMLRAKLFQLEEEKKKKQTEELKGNQKEIGFGSQIRSYVFHPYNMVKDHRTNFETSDVNGVMDGKLDDFIYAYLQWLLSQKNPN